MRPTTYTVPRRCSTCRHCLTHRGFDGATSSYADELRCSRFLPELRQLNPSSPQVPGDGQFVAFKEQDAHHISWLGSYRDSSVLPDGVCDLYEVAMPVGY